MSIFHARGRRRVLNACVAKVTTVHEHAGRVRAHLALQHSRDVLNCGTTRAQHADGAVWSQRVDDSALEADSTRAAVEDELEAPAEVARDVCGARGAGLAGGVGTGCGDGSVGEGNERARDGMGGHADGDGGVLGGDDARYDSGVGGEEEGERAGPEMLY